MKYSKLVFLFTVLFGMMLFYLPATGYVFADNSKTKLTDGESIKVKFGTDPDNPKSGSEAKMKIDFLKTDSDKIQEHIDYKLSVTKGGNEFFNVKLTHTSPGSVTIPFTFPENGDYDVVVSVLGILFQPIQEETVEFPVHVGPVSDESKSTGSESKSKIPNWIRSNAGWWAEGQIGDADFISGIQYLIKNGILKIN